MAVFSAYKMQRIRLVVCLFAAIVVGYFQQAYAQNTADRTPPKKRDPVADSLAALKYPYILPIWGEKVMRKGFNLPKSAGVSVQYLYQQSDIIIDNLKVGFNNGEQYPLDEIIRFNSAVATTNGFNIRPDLWLFPFLNVYGLFAKAKSSTAIDAGVWLPTEAGWTNVANFQTKAEFESTTVGFGVTPTAGVAGFFFALDANFTWSDIDALEKPAYIFVLGPRVGKNFSLKKKDQTLAIWMGGFRVKMASTTNGSLSATELFPIDQWQTRVDQGYDNLASSQEKVEGWWTGLTPAEQKNPANIAKYNTANRALERYGGFLNGASEVVAGAGDASIQYSLDKKPKEMWNFIIGSQFQINRSLMLRAEYGFLGARQQLIAGLQYRFDF